MQDRWHARLFFLAPLLKFVLVTLWLISAIVGLFTGEELARTALAAFGLGAAWAMPVVAVTCLVDLAIVVLILRDRHGRGAALVQTIVIAGYTIAFTIALPSLWLNPLGPLLKNLPIIAAVLCYGAVSDRR